MDPWHSCFDEGYQWENGPQYCKLVDIFAPEALRQQVQTHIDTTLPIRQTSVSPWRDLIYGKLSMRTSSYVLTYTGNLSRAMSLALYCARERTAVWPIAPLAPSIRLNSSKNQVVHRCMFHSRALLFFFSSSFFCFIPCCPLFFLTHHNKVF